MRLLSPDATEGGSAETPAVPNPAATTPTPAPAAPSAPPMIPLTVEEYQRLRTLESSYATLQAQRQADVDAAEAARIKALADKGQVEQAMEELRKSGETRYAAEKAAREKIEGEYLGEKKTAVLTDALPVERFVSKDALQQARTLLEGRFGSERDASGQIVVRERSTGRPAAEVIAEALATPAFSHFLKPTTTGGAGGGGGKPANAGGTGEKPLTAGEKAVAILEARAAGRPSGGLDEWGWRSN